jgi:hypothetical protein
LSGTDGGNSNKPSAMAAAITFPAKYVMSAVGAAVSISGFIALVTAQSVRAWVRSHPFPIYLALIVAVLLIGGTLDYAYNLRKQLNLPSAHDKRLYTMALERLPANGAVIAWLKRAQITEASIGDFPADVLGALDKTVEFSRGQAVGFDDTRIAGSFKSLTEAITIFCQSVDRWTLAAHTVDASVEDETASLTRRHHDLVRAYDRFIRTAHARGIDIDG